VPAGGKIARGMVIGSRKVVTSRTLCVMIVNVRVDWIWMAQVLGFEPVLI
jgi:hypothetical protein